MQNLVVQALTMRQLGRLHHRQLLAAGYGLRETTWCPRTIHTRQLSGCLAFPAIGCHRLTLHNRDPVRSWSVHHLRFKSSKKKGARRALQEEEEEEEEEDEDKEKDPEDSDYEDELQEDPNLPKDYKDLEKYVQSFRYDVIFRAGLDLSHKKIEDAFYGNKLRLNGLRLIKKSKTVKIGDKLDMVLSENQSDHKVTLMRVVIRKVFEEKSNTEKYKVALRRWKFIELSQEEALKP
ncbi:mitochondrial transcription rescue factor 1 isoform X2 [Cynoglossus semilaevis]|uniref:mitochondrial transcription rescue factor 1 isoform X2 n=1 Tax=Cynoglossus semilaevis TaxID=244447 RepID=UPI000D63108D|nr:uncharacterized protein C6orf203 homolog isoform X2 [Cynoglossus semilaevis]